MPDLDWVIVGGLVAGALAGGAARFGRLCTMSAVEDALVARDFRGLKAWGLVLAVAVATTQIAEAAGLVDTTRSLYMSARFHWAATMIGGVMFGLGMALVGTCGFGLLVRAGSGDLRAAVSAVVVGVFAFAVTAGVLAPVRLYVIERDVIGIARLVPTGWGWQRWLFITGAFAVLVAAAFADRRLRNRRNLLAGAVGMGLSITLGWIATTRGVDALLLDRAESLSFVAPVGRALLQFMTDPFRNVGFGVAATAGVIAASCAVAIWRREFRWEAFDDPVEMRRHIAGAALMGIGGVMAQGCTIGQGLSAASTLALSAPVFIACVLVGAKIGLVHLIEGRSLWRLGGEIRSRGRY